MYQQNYGQYVPYDNQRFQRLAQMEQQLQQTQNQPQQMYGGMPVQNTGMYLKGRPVVSIEEARAAQIDLDGSLFIFTDIGNNKIYTKQINLDGTATLNTYSLVDDSVAISDSYVTQSELENIISSLQQEIEQLRNKDGQNAKYKVTTRGSE